MSGVYKEHYDIPGTCYFFDTNRRNCSGYAMLEKPLISYVMYGVYDSTIYDCIYYCIVHRKQ